MSKIFLVGFFTVILWLLVVIPVWAQNEPSSQVDPETQNTAPSKLRSETQGIRKEFNDRAKEARQDVKTQVKTEQVKTEMETKARSLGNRIKAEEQGSENIKAKRTELNTQLKDEREAAKKRLEAGREEAKKAVEERRAELKDKINKLRDEKRKQIVVRLDEQLARINNQWTDHFNNVLNRLSEILGKVELRASKAEVGGKDIAAVKAAIQNAKTAIEAARAAVEVQAKKTYVATFSSEKELGAAFKAVKAQLHADLTSLRDGAMKIARETVHNSLQTLKGIPKVNEDSLK